MYFSEKFLTFIHAKFEFQTSCTDYIINTPPNSNTFIKTRIWVVKVLEITI